MGWQDTWSRCVQCIWSCRNITHPVIPFIGSADKHNLAYLSTDNRQQQSPCVPWSCVLDEVLPSTINPSAPGMLISKHVCCCWCETPDRNILTEKLAMIVRAPLPLYIIVHRRGGHKTQAINKLARTHNATLQRVSAIIQSRWPTNNYKNSWPM